MLLWQKHNRKKMKRLKIILLISILLYLIRVCNPDNYQPPYEATIESHICVDTLYHATCDGLCSCNGLNCPKL